MKKKVDHLYFIRVGDPSESLYKIGTTNNLKRRMHEHEKNYRKPVEVLWVSPAYSKWTTLRVEAATIERWKQQVRETDCTGNEYRHAGKPDHTG